MLKKMASTLLTQGPSGSDPLEIREIGEGEHGFLAEMLRQAVFFPDLTRKDEILVKLAPVLENYFEGFGRKGDLALVLLVNGVLSGAVWTRLYTEQNRSYGFVDEKTPELGIALSESSRSRGFGTQLMSAMEAKLTDLGHDQVSLSVDSRNPALRLYRRLGFQVHSKSENSYTLLKKLGRP
jgi:ribosomal protein S18 acetylase RimI-like enzyme